MKHCDECFNWGTFEKKEESDCQCYMLGVPLEGLRDGIGALLIPQGDLKETQRLAVCRFMFAVEHFTREHKYCGAFSNDDCNLVVSFQDGRIVALQSFFCKNGELIGVWISPNAKFFKGFPRL